jgi:hypothetical protein
MKKFVITEEERNSILRMHVQATKTQYLGEQYSSKVEGTLMDALDAGMMSDLMKLVKDPKQVFVIANKNGKVSTPNSKMLSPMDKIMFNGDGSLIVYPKGDLEATFIIQPRKGKIMLFRGA